MEGRGAWIVLFSEVTPFEDSLNNFVANCCFFVSYGFTQLWFVFYVTYSLYATCKI